MNVSVALCTYNGSRFLSQQIDSILNQSYSVDEIVICDDVSTDNTKDIIEYYSGKYKGVIKFHLNEVPLKTVKNFEKSISLTTGDLIFLADQDDIWHRNKVEIFVNFFQQNKSCLMLFSDGQLIDENGQHLTSTLFTKWGFTSKIQQRWKTNKLAVRDLINNDNKVTGATACIKKELKNFIIPISVPKGTWHDAWIALHAANLRGLFFLNMPLIEYRVHPNQQVGITIGGNVTNSNRDTYISDNEYCIYIKKYFKKDYIYYRGANLSFVDRLKRKFLKCLG